MSEFKGSRILQAFVAQRQAQRRPVYIQPRGYDAAKNDHLTFGWSATSVSANEDVKAALETVRGRSRNLAANNDYMRKFLRMVEVNIVGPHGVRFKSLAADPPRSVGAKPVPDEPARSLIEDHFSEWSRPGMAEVTGRHSLTQCLKLAIKACARDGEYLIRRVRGRKAGNPYQYALQVIDIDRLDVKHNGEAANGNRIIMGVEVNDVGRPVAYHLLTTHPGDNSYISRSGQRYERVVASDVFHGGIADRPEQVRFMPWGHTAMLRLEMLGKFQTAAVAAARKGAETIGVLYRDANADVPTPDLAGAPVGDLGADGNYYQTSLPGQFETLPTGYKIQPLETNYPDAVFGTFVKDCLRGIASGFMVAYNGLANDLEGVNYSSIRAGVLEERDGWMDLQKFFIESLTTPIFNDWLEMALLSSALTYPGSGNALPASKLAKFRPHSFMGRRWSWVDPRNDADANVLARERGWKTDTQITAEMGGDWQDNIAEISLEEKYAEQQGVQIGKPAPVVQQQLPDATAQAGKSQDAPPPEVHVHHHSQPAHIHNVPATIEQRLNPYVTRVVPKRDAEGIVTESLHIPIVDPIEQSKAVQGA